MDKQTIIRLLAPYVGLSVDWKAYYPSVDRSSKGINFSHHIFREHICCTIGPVDFKLKLRPLKTMQPDEALQLCKLSFPEDWGDFRYDKWMARLDEYNDKNWHSYKVTREKTSNFFIVDMIDGLVDYYVDKTTENGGRIAYYRDWFYQQGFDIPTYPTGKTLAELELAYY